MVGLPDHWSALATAQQSNMNISLLFDVFSRRGRPPSKPGGRLTLEFRNRVLQICTENFPLNQDWVGSDAFWPDVHKRLRLLHGRVMLADSHTNSMIEDIFTFLRQCSDDHFLDFVELIFQSGHLWDRHWNIRAGFINHEELVGIVNRFFELEDLPYSLTGFVFPPAPQWESGSRSPLGSDGPPPVEAYPQVIRRENDVLHGYAIEPTLALLGQPHFGTANKEFLEALADYRKSRYGDCVTKCGSSFESALKVICDRKEWQYKQSDTSISLLTTILSRTDLPGFFSEPIKLIATARNRLSSAHGGGTQERVVSKHVARFVINSTASAILLIVDETKQ